MSSHVKPVFDFFNYTFTVCVRVLPCPKYAIFPFWSIQIDWFYLEFYYINIDVNITLHRWHWISKIGSRKFRFDSGTKSGRLFARKTKFSKLIHSSIKIVNAKWSEHERECKSPRGNHAHVWTHDICLNLRFHCTGYSNWYRLL